MVNIDVIRECDEFGNVIGLHPDKTWEQYQIRQELKFKHLQSGTKKRRKAKFKHNYKYISKFYA